MTLEKQGRIMVIAPKEPVTVSRLEKDKEKLKKLYEDGKKDMEESIDKLETLIKQDLT